jgi:hypothetical protein
MWKRNDLDRTKSATVQQHRTIVRTGAIAVTTGVVALGLILGSSTSATEEAPPATTDHDLRAPSPDEVYYVACMRGAAHSPDALEHWVEPCRRHAMAKIELPAAYVTCMRNAAFTSDALENWAQKCA